ncbi:MAG: hypothetical protein MMC23_002231 [Stictis urceolatum]|nr:hypothetical protein [Stictis urceolata]
MTSVPRHHPRFRYALLKVEMTLLRALISIFMAITSPKRRPRAPADERTTYPSASRPQRVDIYLPESSSSSPNSNSSSSKPPPTLLPIHISIHGSGFSIPSHGTDVEFCRYLSDTTPCAVLDIDHRHGPEDPYPAALEDIVSAVRWAESIADSRNWDASRISIGGFSSGGALALIASGAMPELYGRFKAVVAFYPSTNLAQEPGDKPKPKPKKGAVGGVVPVSIRRFFYNCYLVAGQDRADPRVSPIYADPRRFPGSVTIVTCGSDSLLKEARELGEILRGVGKDVVEFEARGQGHAWDLAVKERESEAGVLRDQAYELAARRVREAFGIGEGGWG